MLGPIFLAWSEPQRVERWLEALGPTATDAERPALLAQAQSDGVAEICVPRQVIHVANMPVLGSGKIDYVAATKWVEASS